MHVNVSTLSIYGRPSSISSRLDAQFSHPLLLLFFLAHYIVYISPPLTLTFFGE